MTTAGIQRYICLLGACLLLLSVDPCIAKGHVPVFRKLNSGTQAPIRTLCLTDGANTLYLSEETVRNHIRHIYEKLQVHTRAQAVAKALRERLT